MQDVKAYVEKYQILKSRKKSAKKDAKKDAKEDMQDRWLVRYKYTDNAGKIHDSEKRGFTREKDAKAFRISLIGSQIVAPSQMTMNELLDLWFTDYKSDEDLAENTVLWHYYNLLHLRRGLGIRKVQDIGLLAINSFFDELKKPMTNEKGKVQVLSITTVKNIRRTLNQSLNFAVDNSYILKNPLQALKKKKSTKRSIANLSSSFTPVAISQLKIIQIIETIEDPALKLAIALAGLLGLRRGEIRGLLWSDLDLERKLIHVRMQLTSRKQSRDVLKTVNSIRTIRIPDYVIELLLSMQGFQRQAKKEYGKDKFIAGFVLAHCINRKYIGKPFSSNYFSDSFKAELTKNGFSRMRLHDLRHSFGSNLLYKRVPIPTIANMMGHASVATTLKVYAHEIAELRAVDEEYINNDIADTVLQYRSSKDEAKCSEISTSNTKS